MLVSFVTTMAIGAVGMLITELGYVALISALVISILQVVFPTVGVFKHQPAWQRLAGSFAVAQFLATGVSFLC